MLAGHPKILSCIEADQEAVGKAKKKVRQADQRWQATQTLPLGLCVGEPVATDELTLGQGRPCMKPELVYVFLVLRGYLGSIGDHEARDRLLDSTTVQLYLLRRGGGAGRLFPGPARQHRRKSQFGLADGCADPAGVAGAGLCWQSKTGGFRPEQHPCVVGAAVAEEIEPAVV